MAEEDRAMVDREAKKQAIRSEYPIGVISDTHGLLRSQALDALAGSSIIIHAGDVGAPEILDRLRTIAPVVAVRGNVDTDPWCSALPKFKVVRHESYSIYVLHDIDKLTLDPVAAGLSAVVYGHSHKPSVDWRHGVLFVNPGSAGPRRFTLPTTVARIGIVNGRLVAQLVDIPIDS
jgi:putative phosphoesterase